MWALVRSQIWDSRQPLDSFSSRSPGTCRHNYFVQWPWILVSKQQISESPAIQGVFRPNKRRDPFVRTVPQVSRSGKRTKQRNHSDMKAAEKDCLHVSCRPSQDAYFIEKVRRLNSNKDETVNSQTTWINYLAGVTYGRNTSWYLPSINRTSNRRPTAWNASDMNFPQSLGQFSVSPRFNHDVLSYQSYRLDCTSSVLPAIVSPGDSEQIQRVYNLRTDQLWLRNDMAELPISLKKCSWSLRVNKAAAMLWTGASPHLCVRSAWHEQEKHLTCLIVKPSCILEIVEEFCVSFAPPEVHIGNFKVWPNWVRGISDFSQHDIEQLLQWHML